MKNYEKELLKPLEFLKKNTKVSLDSFEKVIEEFSRVFVKIQKQREELETSRDNWKKKYFELKSEADE